MHPRLRIHSPGVVPKEVVLLLDKEGRALTHLVGVGSRVLPLYSDVCRGLLHMEPPQPIRSVVTAAFAQLTALTPNTLAADIAEAFYELTGLSLPAAWAFRGAFRTRDQLRRGRNGDLAYALITRRLFCEVAQWEGEGRGECLCDGDPYNRGVPCDNHACGHFSSGPSTLSPPHSLPPGTTATPLPPDTPLHPPATGIPAGPAASPPPAAPVHNPPSPAPRANISNTAPYVLAKPAPGGVQGSPPAMTANTLASPLHNAVQRTSKGLKVAGKRGRKPCTFVLKAPRKVESGTRRRQSYPLFMKQGLCYKSLELEQADADKPEAEKRTVTNRWLGEWFFKEFELSVSDSSLCKWLGKEMGKILSSQHEVNALRLRFSPYILVEQALHIWLEQHIGYGGHVSDRIIQEKAMQVMSELQRRGADPSLVDFSASNGWVGRFKKRWGYWWWIKQGEGLEADNVGADSARLSIPLVIAKYAWAGPHNIFNLDETGLCINADPSRSTARAQLTGMKKFGMRCTLVLITDMLGVAKHQLWVIGRAAKPRSFPRGWKHEEHCLYTFQAKAWMDSTAFTAYVEKWDCRLLREGGRALLLIDNCSAHRLIGVSSGKYQPQMLGGCKIIEMAALVIVFFPPNTTSILQPLDAGIIACLKMRYKAALIHWKLQEKEKRANASKGWHEIKMPLKGAIVLCSRLWEELEPEIVARCFRATGLFDRFIYAGAPKDDPNADLAAAATSPQQSIALMAIPEEEAWGAFEYANLKGEENVAEPVTVREAVRVALGGELVEPGEEDVVADDAEAAAGPSTRSPQPKEAPKIAVTRGEACSKEFLEFLEQNKENVDPSDLDFARKLAGKVARVIGPAVNQQRATQRSLTDWISGTRGAGPDPDPNPVYRTKNGKGPLEPLPNEPPPYVFPEEEGGPVTDFGPTVWTDVDGNEVVIPQRPGGLQMMREWQEEDLWGAGITPAWCTPEVFEENRAAAERASKRLDALKSGKRMRDLPDEDEEWSEGSVESSEEEEEDGHMVEESGSGDDDTDAASEGESGGGSCHWPEELD